MSGDRSGAFYLVVSPKGRYDLAARITARPPALGVAEVALALSITVPDSLFRKPQLRAAISIPSDQVAPLVIDAAVLDNVREALQQQTGLEVTVSLVEPTTPTTERS